MANDVRLNFLNDVQGMEELVRLINRVDALEKSMDRYKAAAGRVSAASPRMTAALDNQGKAARRAQLGAQQLGLQLNDLSTSISTGANPMYALNQQLGQIGYAMSQMQGKAQKLGNFLAGTWGAIIGLAAMGLYTLWQNQEENTKAAADLTQAFDFQAASVDDLRAANEALAESLDSGADSQKRFREQVIATTQENIRQAKSALDAAEAELARRSTFVEFGTTPGAAAFRDSAEESIGSLNERVKELRSSIGNMDTVLRQNVGAWEAWNAGASEAEKITRQMDIALSQWRTAYEAGEVSQEAYRSGLADVRKEFEPLIEAASQSERVTRRSARTNRSAANEADRAAKAYERLRDQMRGILLENAFGSEASGRIRELERFNDLVKELSSTSQGQSFLETIGAEKLEAIRGELRLSKDLVDEIKDGEPLKIDFEVVDVTDDVTRMLNGVRDELRGYTDEMKQSFDEVGRSVSDAFLGMLTGASSWKDGMRSIIQEVIAQLWRLYVVQTIVGVITNSIGSIGLPGPKNAIKLGARASGGPVSSNQPYIVGEKGPEIMIPGRSGTVVSNDNIGNMGGGVTVNVDARGATDPAQVKQIAEKAILEAAPIIVAASQKRTVTAAQRPRLPGGSY